MGKEKKIYSQRAIRIATLLGTPIASGYLIGKNFSAWGNHTAAKISYIAGVLSTVLVIIAFLNLPSEILEKIPHVIIPLIYVLIIDQFVSKYQLEKIEQYLNNKDLKQSNWKATGIGILGSLIATVLWFSFSYFQPLYPGELNEYGSKNHYIYYEDKVSTTFSDSLAFSLAKIGYFTNSYQNVAHIGKRDEFYVVTLPVDKQFWENQQILDSFYALKEDVKSKFETNKVIIRLHHFGFLEEDFKEL